MSISSGEPLSRLLQIDELAADQIEELFLMADAGVRRRPLSGGRMADPEEALRAAAVLLRQAYLDLTRYESHRRILAAFQTTCPGPSQSFRFSPERAIELPADTPPCPKPDTRYADLTGTSVPPGLAELPTEHLPDGAIRPVLEMLGARSQRPHDAGSEDDTVVPLLVRYGARCYPCIMRALAHPDTAVIGRGPNRRLLFEVVCALPRELAVRVFRAMLEAGWYKPLHYMPKWTERAELAREFRDTPYGLPRIR